MPTELGIRYLHPVTHAYVYRWADEDLRVSLPVTIGQPPRSADASSPEALLADLLGFEADYPAVASIGLEAVSRSFEPRLVRRPLPETVGSVIEATVHGKTRTRLVFVTPTSSFPWRTLGPALRAEWVHEDDLSDVTVLWEAPPLEATR